MSGIGAKGAEIRRRRSTGKNRRARNEVIEEEESHVRIIDFRIKDDFLFFVGKAKGCRLVDDTRKSYLQITAVRS